MFASIVAQFLKLSTICKSPLHGPRSYVDRTWERSANYSARTILLPISTPTTVSKILPNSPTTLRFLIQKNKATQSATIDLTPSYKRRTEVAVQRDSKQEGACTVIGRPFPRSVDHIDLHIVDSLKAMLHEAIFLATCNATMTNKIQRGCHTFATFFVTCNG